MQSTTLCGWSLRGKCKLRPLGCNRFLARNHVQRRFNTFRFANMLSVWTNSCLNWWHLFHVRCSLPALQLLIWLEQLQQALHNDFSACLVWWTAVQRFCQALFCEVGTTMPSSLVEWFNLHPVQISCSQVCLQVRFTKPVVGVFACHGTFVALVVQCWKTMVQSWKTMPKRRIPLRSTHNESDWIRDTTIFPLSIDSQNPSTIQTPLV